MPSLTSIRVSLVPVESEISTVAPVTAGISVISLKFTVFDSFTKDGPGLFETFASTTICGEALFRSMLITFWHDVNPNEASRIRAM
jgi:hypothetical protein